MDIRTQLAKHVKDVHFGGNWTSSCLKEHLTGLTWQQATRQIYGLNSIAILTFHMNYYISEVIKVLHGEPLLAKDKFSFELPPIECQEDWETILTKTWDDAGKFASLLEQMPEQQLWENFTDEKYGSYYRNMQGIIEHLHYHLGQIVIIKKLLMQEHPERRIDR